MQKEVEENITEGGLFMRLLRVQKHSQEDIFDNYSWWQPTCTLNLITNERCDYIQSCVEQVFGRESLAQQEILEVGSGGGLICEELIKRGAVATGIDPSAGAIQTAYEHIIASGLGNKAYFQQGYAEKLPYSDGSFSVIVCLDVLEHVQDLTKTIQEIARVLAPGGVFVFDTINRTFIARLVLIWIGERFFQRYGLVPGLHNYQQFIKPAELQSILTQHGLQVHEMVGFVPRLRKGRLTLGPGSLKSVSYVGYATKN